VQDQVSREDEVLFSTCYDVPMKLSILLWLIEFSLPKSFSIRLSLGAGVSEWYDDFSVLSALRGLCAEETEWDRRYLQRFCWEVWWHNLDQRTQEEGDLCIRGSNRFHDLLLSKGRISRPHNSATWNWSSISSRGIAKVVGSINDRSWREKQISMYRNLWTKNAIIFHEWM
jgi:hypothetical protein